LPPPTSDPNGGSTWEEEKEIAEAFVDALAMAPRLKKLRIGSTKVSAHDRMVDLLGKRCLQALAYETPASRGQRTSELAALKMDDLLLLFSAPSLRYLALRCTWDWRIAVNLPLHPPPASLASTPNHVTTLILTCDNVPLVFALVKITESTLIRAQIYTECEEPPEEALDAWSTTTETLVA
jgi:hypothetical protein